MMWILALLVVAGVALGVWTLATRSEAGRARELLDERLARGEISVEEHRDRAAAVGSGRVHARSVWLAVAAGLVVLGLVGGGVAAATTMGWGPMGRMMDGMMDGMRGGGMMDGMMGSGETERVGPPPERDASKRHVTATEFAFEPDDIRLRAGETVNVVLSNDGMMHHTFTVRGLDLDLRARAGDTISGALRPTEPGTFTVVCTVPGHAEAGMRATIEVVG